MNNIKWVTLQANWVGYYTDVVSDELCDKIMDYSSKWDTQMEDDMIWPKVKILLNNYKKLLTFDKKECKMILINLTNME